MPEPQVSPVLIGIDWANKEHVVFVRTQSGGRTVSLEQSPDAIQAWVERLTTEYPDRPIWIAVEQKGGPLVLNLLEYKQLTIYPINPLQLARYREALFPSGAKSDPTDAQLLAQFLHEHHQRLRPLRQDSEETRKLGQFTRFRRDLVEERKRLDQKLHALLQRSFPWLLSKCGANAHHPRLLTLLRRWPSLSEMQRQHPRILRRILKETGMTNKDRQTQWINDLKSATPLTTDPAIIEPHAKMIGALVKQLQELNRSVDEMDEQIEVIGANHPEVQRFQAIPGAGAALAPRLAAAFGDDRDRFTSPEEVVVTTGIAPITVASGKQKRVSKRNAGNKFLRQTFVEFAEQARRWCRWSKAYYNQQREKGKKHQAILRSLAAKWIRI